VDNRNGTDNTSTPRVITVNQAVAWNLAYYRMTAGLTQQELGARIGWSGAAVSEAERSWDGKRTREFDADILIAIARALEVPVNAFFLPPEMPGLAFRPPGADADLGMGDLLFAVIAGSDDEHDAMDAYRRRMLAAAAIYLDSGWETWLATWRVPLMDREARAEAARRIRALRDTILSGASAILGSADILASMAGAIEQDGEDS